MKVVPVKFQNQRRSHKEIFLDLYDNISQWSLQITRYDHELAQDLVHEAYIQFTLSEPDLSTIVGIDKYLYGILRNLHSSHLRRSARQRLEQLSTVGYDSAEDVLLSVDPRRLIKAQEELRAVCHYARLRKETSISGSVLLLRYFLGYFPSEAAQVIRSSRNVIDARLKSARREAKAYLENPYPPAAVKQSSLPSSPNLSFDSDNILADLRREIFAAPRGTCFLPEQIKGFYQANVERLTQAAISHLVSCPRCLDEVNKLLGLTLLRDRYPIDFLRREGDMEKDDYSDGGDGDDGGAGGDEGATPPKQKEQRRSGKTLNTNHNHKFRVVEKNAIDTSFNIKKAARGLQRVYEHCPDELFVAVNGYIQGSQKINGKLNELTLDISLAEPISFIELFSEQQVRLMLINVFDSPPSGTTICRQSLQLSDERWIEITLEWSHPHPTIKLFYFNPLADALPEFNEETEFAEVLPMSAPVGATIPNLEQNSAVQNLDFEYLESLASSNRYSLRVTISSLISLIKTRLTLTPMSAAVWISLFVIGTLIVYQTQFAVLPPSPAAAQSSAVLVEQAVLAEDHTVQSNEQILHRTIELEERRISVSATKELPNVSDVPVPITAATAPPMRHRLEIWQDTERKNTTKRLFNENGSMIAGSTTRPGDGVSIVYRRGRPAQLQLLSNQKEETSSAPVAEFENFWLMELSAKTISRLGLKTVNETPEIKDNSYLIHFIGDDQPNPVQELIHPADRIQTTEENIVRSEAERSLKLAPMSGGKVHNQLRIVRASLRLNKADLRAIEQVLVFEQNGERRELAYREAKLERYEKAQISAKVFELEPELTNELLAEDNSAKQNELAAKESSPVTESTVLLNNAIPDRVTDSTAAQITPELELEVLRLLNVAGADMGEQIAVTRTTQGKLRVEAVVDEEQRKDELLRALDSIRSNKAVEIRIRTVAEAVKHQSTKKIDSSEPQTPTGEPTEFPVAESAAKSELRQHFAKRGAAGRQLDEAVNNYSNQLLSRSWKITQRGFALKNLANRFTAEQLEQLPPAAKEKWLNLARHYAAQIKNENNILKGEIKQVFNLPGEPKIAVKRISSERELLEAIAQLTKLCQANHQLISQSFASRGGSGSENKINSANFRNALVQIQALSEAIGTKF